MVSLDNEGGFIKHFSYNEYLEEFPNKQKLIRVEKVNIKML